MRFLAGARPTGSLHVGHYFGMLDSLVSQANDEKAELFFVVADLHMFTTNATRSSTAVIQERILNLIADCVSVGLDPGRCTFYVQSDVPSQARLYAIIQSLVRVRALRGQISFKAMLGGRAIEDASLGLLGYPVLEAADVIGLGATDVAVGDQNVDHVTIAREVVAELEQEFGLRLPAPTAVFRETRDLIGLDGANKMSKSLGNAIELSATPEEVAKAVEAMAYRTTDGQLLAPALLDVIGSPESAAEVRVGLESGTLSWNAARDLVARAFEAFLEPIRDRRTAWEPDHLRDVLRAGAQRAEALTGATVEQVREALHFGVR
ncbi:tryptophan--tRNA ligase [Micromonospora rubida]|uniref:tryptophan--tRNA ligase n=1 Tax=Micromonospora rubida TaxID=2697657 RepID=UPI001376AC10|nr:hypothetical protein [Micromonospora rubida]NBE84037.1 hypothetical protein [Micromonospora rubida]